MKKRVLIVLLCFVGALSSAFAAEKKVQGVVISSEDNLPLIGASVYVTAEDLKKAGSAQTTMGVITDVDGQFSIAIPAGITRFFCSYVGYDVLEVKLVPGKEHYEITLHASSQMLDAVVVTGYQTVERRKLTAAVSKLDISDETIGAVKSIDQALAGQIAGLSVSPTSGAPGAPAKIRIRGTASLNGTQDPLWVLDGIPLEGTDVPEPDELNDITNMKQSSIAGLNPADIENITILKDAAATAIYGARAANGVIVITTKKGKVGKPVINFSSRFTYTPTLSLDRLNLLNSAEKVGLEMDMIRNNYSPDNHKGGVYNILSNYNELSAFQNGGWDALSSDTQAAINRLKSVNTNWGDILFRDAFSQEYNLSLSGGTERVTYYTSFGYYKEDGNVDGVGMDRFNLVGKTSYKVNSILKVGASMFANRRKNTNYLTDAYGMSNPVFYSRKANPYFELYDKNGNYNYDYDIQNNTDKDLGFNIFEERQNTSNESVVNSFSSIFDAELRFNDKWKLTSQFGYQLEKTSREEIADWESYAMRYYYKLSEYSQGGETKHFLPEGGMQKSYENSNSQITWKAMGEYRDSFNDIHELEVMAGTELRKTWYETLFSAGYGFDRKTLTTKPVIFPNESYATSFPLHQTTYKENAYVSFIKEGTEEEINQLVGEAYMLRAYVHFLLVNLYGQPYTKEGALDTKSVPLKLDTDLEKVLKRNTVEEVYTSIQADIDEARKLVMKAEWEQRYSYRFNAASVEAFQSRVSLYKGEWQAAWDAAEAVLAVKSVLVDLNDAAATLPNSYNSVENITPLETPLSSTINGAALATPVFLSLYAENDLRLDKYFAETDEKGFRKNKKAGSNNYLCTFRVGEIYLTAAEAAARLGELSQARTRLLELMRKRYAPEAYEAKSVVVNAMDKEALVQEILDERARELAFEGHRWFDLRRSTRPRLEKVLDGTRYVLEENDARYTLAIPKEAIEANPGLLN